MAYEDPAFISSERMNLSLTPAEKQVMAIAAINGVQPTTFMKMLAFSALRREHGIDLDTNSQEKRRANA